MWLTYKNTEISECVTILSMWVSEIRTHRWQYKHTYTDTQKYAHIQENVHTERKARAREDIEGARKGEERGVRLGDSCRPCEGPPTRPGRLPRNTWTESPPPTLPRHRCYTSLIRLTAPRKPLSLTPTPRHLPSSVSYTTPPPLIRPPSSPYISERPKPLAPLCS